MILQPSWTSPDREWSTDACDKGCRGFSNGEYFHARFPQRVILDPDIHINELECLAIVVALKCWGPRCARYNYWHSATMRPRYRLKIMAKHEIPLPKLASEKYVSCVQKRTGVSNRKADLLSSVCKNRKALKEFMECATGFDLKEIKIMDEHFKFLHDW